jgi:hypothetical protein
MFSKVSIYARSGLLGQEGIDVCPGGHERLH